MHALDRVHWWIDRDMGRDLYDLFMTIQTTRGEIAYIKEPPIPTIIPEEEAGQRIPPLLSMGRGGLQTLMDELWRVGVRPSKEISSLGQLEAVQSHLEDMRIIAFKKLNIEQ